MRSGRREDTGKVLGCPYFGQPFCTIEGQKKCLLKQDLAVLVESLGVSIGLEVLLIYAAGFAAGLIYIAAIVINAKKRRTLLNAGTDRDGADLGEYRVNMKNSDISILHGDKEIFKYDSYLNETNKTGVIAIAWNLIRERTKDITPETVGSRSQEELEYSGAFFLYGITGLVRRWLAGGCNETPEELFAILERQFDPERMKAISF